MADAERQTARLKRSREGAVAAAKAALYGAGDEATAPMYERAVSLLPGGATAVPSGLLRKVFEDDGKSAWTNPMLNSALDKLRDAPEAEGGWQATEGYPEANDAASRGVMRELIDGLRLQADEERKSKMIASQLSPERRELWAEGGAAAGGASVGGRNAGGGGGDARAVSKTKEERDTDRYADCGAWLKMQEPAPRDPLHIPSKKAVCLFDGWSSAATMPALPTLAEVKKAGRMQQPAPGRECPIADAEVALLALQKAYAGPAPEGVPWGDVTEKEKTLTVQRAGANGAVVETKEPPALSARLIDEMIDGMWASAGPLANAQQEAISRDLWNDLVSAVGGASEPQLLTQVLRAAYKDNATQREAKRQPRRDPKPANASGGGGGGGGNGQSPKGVKPPNGGKNKSFDVAALPVCAAWLAGGCAAFDRKECRNFKHPRELKGTGRGGGGASSSSAAASSGGT